MHKDLVIRDHQVSFYRELYLTIPALDCLVLSDIHLAKSNHFRRNGIALTQGIHDTDLITWQEALDQHSPKLCIITGDLFHSTVQEERNRFYEFLESYPGVEFILTAGNHDPVLPNPPINLKITDIFELGPFRFVHEASEESELYQFSGHLHPLVRLHGKARRRVTLKAFWVRTNHCVLPAFGYTTFGKTVKPAPSDLLLGASPQGILTLDYDDFSKTQR